MCQWSEIQSLFVAPNDFVSHSLRCCNSYVTSHQECNIERSEDETADVTAHVRKQFIEPRSHGPISSPTLLRMEERLPRERCCFVDKTLLSHSHRIGKTFFLNYGFRFISSEWKMPRSTIIALINNTLKTFETVDFLEIWWIGVSVFQSYVNCRS